MSVSPPSSFGSSLASASDSEFERLFPDAASAKKTTISATLNDIARLLADAHTSDRPLGEKGQTDDGISNDHGAPSLALPSLALSPDDMFSAIVRLSTKMQQERLETLKDNVLVNKSKMDKNLENTQLNSQALRAKLVEADKSEKLGKIFGWVGKIMAVVVSVAIVAVTAVAAIASGGAAIPLLALSVMALIGATMSLADQASKELGGPEISLSNLVSSGSVQLLKTFGVEQDEAEKIGKVLVGVAAVALPVLLLIEPQMVGTMATGICELAGASPETAAIVGAVVGMVAAFTVGIVVVVGSGGVGAVPSAMAITNGIVRSGGQVVQGGTMMATGAMKISTAVTTAQASEIQAATLELKANKLVAQKCIEQDQDTMRNVLEQVQNSMQAASQIIRDLYASLSQISTNIGRRAPV
ncbi:type III secretion system translocon subunit SctE [Bordetella tumulicola]|uniref:type III secretion system translocon subunit SctE n=1 Tax=Bordetella tumulicola TaxID=1649133 RepID=UPI0039EE1CB7